MQIKSFTLDNWADSGGDFKIINIDAIGKDIKKEIMTELGTRLYLPNFGTRIPSLVFEPNDKHSLMIIEEDIKKVIKNDPRVDFINLKLYSSTLKHTVMADINLKIKNTDIEFFINLELEQKV